MRRIYLDHAATSWPKPPGVVQAFVEYQETCGAAAGRGSYSSAALASRIVTSTRRKLAALINAESAGDIAFTSNGTAALNLALAGILIQGDHVVATAAEHNSVLRPLTALQIERGISFTILPCDATGYVDPNAVSDAMQPNTKLIVATHASNVTGRIQAIDALASIAKKHSAWLLVDAAQTLGYIPIDVRSMGIDILAAPGHKGACGLLGTGMLYACPEVASKIQTPWPGGTGTESDQLEGPFAWPEGVEAGNLNVPALAAWDRGLDWLSTIPMSSRFSGSLEMKDRMLESLRSASIGRVIGHESSKDYVPVISLETSTIPCSDWAALLDSSFSIEVRSGLHCAAKIHDFLGTRSCGGTLRFSLGHTSTDQDLDALDQACHETR